MSGTEGRPPSRTEVHKSVSRAFGEVADKVRPLPRVSMTEQLATLRADKIELEQQYHLCFQDLKEARAERDRYRAALEQIDSTEVDWAQGVDENCERLKTVAREALTRP